MGNNNQLIYSYSGTFLVFIAVKKLNPHPTEYDIKKCLRGLKNIQSSIEMNGYLSKYSKLPHSIKFAVDDMYLGGYKISKIQKTELDKSVALQWKILASQKIRFYFHV